MANMRVVSQHHQTIESIRQFDEEGREFWLARPLAKELEYSEYRHFQPVIERAKDACRNSGHPVDDHFGRETPDCRYSSPSLRLLSKDRVISLPPLGRN